LSIAEEYYGPRDRSYTILGVEFSNDNPRIWYPGNCGNVVVQLGPVCATDMSRACFQLAHEAIHLLSPSGSSTTTVLDEGLAEYFSVRYVREEFNANWHSDIASYLIAGSLTEQLLAIDSGIIRAIRQLQPALHLVTAPDIHATHPDVPPELAVALTQPFQR
jgi:hypothetical protein